MSVLLIIFLILCTNKLAFAENGFHKDYLDINRTAAIKGIFVVLVFFSHFCGYIDVGEVPYSKLLVAFNRYNGQAIVAMFLFYSGFGIGEAIKKKKMPYVLSIPRKRCLKILINFDIAVILFLLVRCLLGFKTDIKQFLLSLTTWDSIGNSNWYIFAALMTYLITFIAFVLLKGKLIPGTIATTVLALALIAVIIPLKDYWWYDTILCYVLGLWYSVLHDKIESLLYRSDIIYYGSLLIVFSLHILAHMRKKVIIPYEIVTLLTFTILVVIISMKIRVDNPMLQFLGRHTFSFYILQRIPMMFLSHKFNVSAHPFYYFILSLLITIVIGLVYDYLTDKLWNMKTNVRQVKAAAGR